MKHAFVFLVGIALAALSAEPAMAQGAADRDWFWHSTWGWGHMMFGSFMMIVFWGGIIALVVLLVRWLTRGETPDQRPPALRSTPLEILQERFAKGEIDKEEYEERKRLLSE